MQGRKLYQYCKVVAENLSMLERRITPDISVFELICLSKHDCEQ